MRYVLSVCVALLAATMALHGQSASLRVTQIDATQFPSVQIKVEIRRNGTLIRQFTRSNFAIVENGIPQTVEDASCPSDADIRFSIAILLDRSGSMTNDRFNRPDPDSTKIRQAKSAIGAFLGFLEDRDEAALYSFSSDNSFPVPSVFFQANQNFTKDVTALRNSMVPIFARGGTWIWRAMLRTLDSLKTRQGKKVLVVITDGRSQDVGTGNTVSAVITKARDAGIPVYAIGLGDDIDEDALNAIANSTNGRYYRAPSEADLMNVFATLAGEIITDACVLRYTSTASCFDGTLRDVDVSVSGNAFFAEDRTSYTAPFGLSPATLSLSADADIQSKTEFSVPVLLAERLVPQQPVSLALTVRYDPSRLRLLGTTTAGTISEGGALVRTELRPGEERFSLSGHMPAFVTGPVFTLNFISYGAVDTTPVVVELIDAALTQRCPSVATGGSVRFSLLPCQSTYVLTLSQELPAPGGSEAVLPLIVTPPILPGTEYDLTFAVRSSDPGFRFSRFDVTGDVAAMSQQQRTPLPDGVRIRITGTASKTVTVIGEARFATTAGAAASAHPLQLSELDFRTECATTASADPFTALVDGACERVLDRVPVEQFITAHPNPFNPSTMLRFALPRQGDARISIVDASGREVARAVDAEFDAGEWRVRFDAGALPAGAYRAMLVTPQGISSVPLLLVK